MSADASTEFDGDGFSAVSSFFGGDGRHIRHVVGNEARLGLGSGARVPSLENNDDSYTKKRIMSIGKKRKLDKYHDVDDDEDDIHSSTEEDKEEGDAGRSKG